MSWEVGGGTARTGRRKPAFEGCSYGQCHKQLSAPSSSPVTDRSSEVQSDGVTVSDQSEWLRE